MLTPKEKLAQLRALAAAYNNHDPVACAALFAENTLLTLQTGVKLEGRQAVEEHWRRSFVAYPDTRTEILKVLTPTPETAVIEHTVEGTHLGPVTRGNQQIPPTGRPFNVQLLSTYTFNPEGKFIATVLAGDPYLQERQLGLLKAPFVSEEIAVGKVKKFIEAINQNELPTAAACLAEQVVFGSNVMGELRGREPFVKAMEQNHAAFPDGRMTIKSIAAEDNVVVATLQLKGTNTGKLPFREATGKPIDVAITAIYEVGPMGIFAYREYMDGVRFNTQLGIIKE